MPSSFAINVDAGRELPSLDDPLITTLIVDPAMAAHEAGHALQHHTAHVLFRIRGSIAPAAMVSTIDRQASGLDKKLL